MQVKVDTAYNFIVYKNSNSTNIWNEGFWTSAPLPLTTSLLAEHNPSGDSRIPAKQVIQTPHFHAPRLSHSEIIPSRKAALKPNVALNISWNYTLPSQWAKGAFLSIVSGPKKLCNSINWGKRSLKFVTLHFFKSHKQTRSLHTTHANISFTNRRAESSRVVHLFSLIFYFRL